MRDRGVEHRRPEFPWGKVCAHEAAKATGIRLVVGCRLDLSDGMSILVYPTDRTA
jgi:error-prone DNA polymerase